MGPRGGLDGCRKSRPHKDSIPGPSNPWQFAILTKLSRPTFIFLIGIRANDVKVCNTQQGRTMENQRKRDAVIKQMTKET